MLNNDTKSVETTPIHPATHIGFLTLIVDNLTRQLAFYTESLGFTVLSKLGSTAVLGVAGRPIVVLEERVGARPRPASSTGLYHVAFRVPSRGALGQVLQHLFDIGYPLQGSADHLVSEAVYLADPEGNGIELYWDRPRSSWQWDGEQVKMAADPFDFKGVLAAGEQTGGQWQALHPDTDLGHMHLQVAQIAEAADFYSGVLGFSVMSRWHGAIFVSAGGYHHHIGLNTWQSRGAQRPPVDTVGLRAFSVVLPDEAAQHAVYERVYAAGLSIVEQAGKQIVYDPWGNGVVLTTRTSLSMNDASALTALQPVRLQ